MIHVFEIEKFYRGLTLSQLTMSRQMQVEEEEEEIKEVEEEGAYLSNDPRWI